MGAVAGVPGGTPNSAALVTGWLRSARTPCLTGRASCHLHMHKCRRAGITP